MVRRLEEKHQVLKVEDYSALLLLHVALLHAGQGGYHTQSYVYCRTICNWHQTQSQQSRSPKPSTGTYVKQNSNGPIIT